MTAGREDVWLRLTQLEKCCLIDLSSFYSSEGVLQWRLSVTRRDGASAPIVIERTKAVDAVVAGLAAAEERSWQNS